MQIKYCILCHQYEYGSRAPNTMYEAKPSNVACGGILDPYEYWDRRHNLGKQYVSERVGDWQLKAETSDQEHRTQPIATEKRRPAIRSTAHAPILPILPTTSSRMLL